ncbi:polysaccharide pyruvyl transferase family protein [Tabrizicola sp. WMC-M-20]|nr:polysaccharide pyruvyl transferase family protein [Tabrizicola sp. WMC-M-20]
MTGKKIVLMNHTDMQGHHFGCARVMRLIEDGLTSRGCVITARLDGKMDWRKDAQALSVLADCDAIVTNGEGTLHHGKRKAGWLMAAGTHDVTRDKEMALINALYQDNPQSWAPMLRGFRHLYARDSRSAEEMARQAGRAVPWFGDLSTSDGKIDGAVDRAGIVVGDSVSTTTTDALGVLAMALSAQESVHLVPLTTSWYEENPYRSWPSRWLRRRAAQKKFLRRQERFPLYRHLPSEAAYLDLLRESRLLVTGRFHGVCLSLVTGTPFVTVSSNSWKIEALFADVGLDPRRLVKTEDLTTRSVLETDWSFSDTEVQNINAFLDRNKACATAMYDAIAG